MAAALLVILALLAGHLPAVIAASGRPTGGPPAAPWLHPLARVLDTAAGGPDAPAARTAALALVILGASGLLVARFVRRLTGNRIVSVVSAAIFVIHPSTAGLRTGRLGLAELLTTFLMLLALVLDVRPRRDAGAAGLRRPARPDVPVLVAAVAALLAGPAAVALPLLFLLTDEAFPAIAGRPSGRRPASHLALHGALALLAALLLAPGRDDAMTRRGEAVAEGVPVTARARVAALATLAPPPDAASAAGSILEAAVVVAGALALAAHRALHRRRPRLLVLYAGFAGLWYGAAALLPPGPSSIQASLVGPALLVSAGLWRAALRIAPPASAPESAAVLPPPPDLALLRRRADLVLPIHDPGLPAAFEAPPAGGDAPGEGGRVLADLVRAAVREELGTLFGPPPRPAAARPAGGTAAGPGRRLVDAGAADLLSRTIFDGYLRPHITPASVVLDVDSTDPGLTIRFLPFARRVVAVSGTTDGLPLPPEMACPPDNLDLVVADATELAPIRDAAVDFVVTSGGLDMRSLPAIFRLLRTFARVLRPSGRGALFFTDLLDPARFREFADAAAGSAGAGAIETCLTADVVRRLLAGSGLRLDSVHVMADDRHTLALFSKAGT